VGGLIVLCGAFCYAELGATFPKAGGPYAYLNNGLGPLWGFLFGWMSAFLERPVAMATLAAGFARFLVFFSLPLDAAVYAAFVWRRVRGDDGATTRSARRDSRNGGQLLSVKISGAIQMALTSIKVGAIVLIVVGGFLFGTKHVVENAATAVRSRNALIQPNRNPHSGPSPLFKYAYGRPLWEMLRRVPHSKMLRRARSARPQPTPQNQRF